jgi:two-component system CheB/CheR fusion protein
MRKAVERETAMPLATAFESAHSLVQARLAAIVESSDDAMISKTLDGIIQTWNRGAERLFGYTASEAVGQHITLIIPRERLDEENEIIARIAAGERVVHFETVRVSRAGRRVDISLTVSPIRDGSGRIVGASKVARDISEGKLAEKAMRDAVARKDEFIALLAHELRNPLAPLRNGLRLMRIAANDAAICADARAMMERQLGHMVRLVDDLLDASRMSRRKRDLRRAVVSLADVIDTAVETSKPLIDAAAHWLTVSLPNESVFVDADLTRLAQVFGNLLINSAKYTPRGGNIWLEATLSGKDVVVAVRDSGAGISAEAMPRIFEMFSQVDRNLARGSGGLGIGLALVKGLVEMHGGTVNVASAGEGRGSTFTVKLPTVDRDATVAAARREDPVEIAPLRILVVDDSRDSVASLATLLRAVGHEVHEAYDGEEAIIRAGEIRPDLILMDIGMPRLSGYAATQRIREFEWGKDIFIIALTGWGQSADRQRSRVAGCDAHLVKPVDLEGLNACLATRHAGSPVR